MAGSLVKSRIFLTVLLAVAVGVITVPQASAACFCHPNFMPADLGDGLKCYRYRGVGTIGRYGDHHECSSTNMGGDHEFPDPSVVFAADLAAAKTGTQSATATDTSTATSTADEIAAEEIQQIGEGEIGSQEGALKAAVKAAELGAYNRATQGISLCAAGANENLESSSGGAENIAGCRDKFKVADELAKVVTKTGGDGALKPDQNVLNEESSKVTLEKFEKNFGVEKDEFVNRLLASHGSPSELKDLLSSKLSDDRFDQLMTMADEIPPAAFEASKGEILANITKKPIVSTSLRDSLKQKLAAAEEEENREPSSVEMPEVNPRRKPDVYKNLQPAGLEGILNATDGAETDSLTLFDVVRMKLREYTAKQHL